MSAPPTASPTSVVNVRRAAFRSSSSSRPSSWIGTRPARRPSIFSCTTSRTTTSCPSSAKHPPVTRPTYPAPKTATFTGLLPLHGAERLQALCDGEHRLVREPVEQRVDHPVARLRCAQHHHVQLRPVVVEVVGAAADVASEAPVGQNRRVLPVRLLDAPVLVGAHTEHEADGLVLLGGVDPVHPRGLG